MRIHGAALILLLVGAPAVTLAADYVVAPTGNDAATGRPGAPWKTLQKAADTVAEGDVVTVEDGNYQGFVLEGKQLGPGRVVFVARNRWKARITTPTGKNVWGGIAIISSSHVTIDGFEVTGMPKAGISFTSGLDDPQDDTGADTRNNIVQNCWSHDNGGPTPQGGHDGIFTGYARNVLIQNNLVENNAEHGIYVSNSADGPVIRGNIVRGNTAQGIQINGDGDLPGDGIISNWEISGNELSGNSFRGGSTAINLDGAVNGRAFNNLIHGNGKGGFVLWMGNGNASASDNVFFNNTVYNPAGARAAFLLYTGASGNVIFNNILYARGGGLAAEEAGAGNQHDHNLASSFEDLTMSAGESSPDGASLFANAAGGDLHLRAGSAAVDRGVATFSGKMASAGDLEGRQRPAGAAFDIGCYELGGTPGVVEPPPVEPSGGTDGGAAPRDPGGSRDAGGQGPGADAMVGTGGDGGDGCGCHLGQPAGESGRSAALLFLATLSLVLLRRRRSA